MLIVYIYHRSNTMRKQVLLILSIAITFIGCAGTVQKPRIYAPGETSTLGSLPPQYFKATGEQRYCSHGLPDVVQERKKQAYANIAEVCGGEDNYAIIGELSGTAYTVALGVETGCAGLAGRVIYFKCRGTKPTSSGNSR